ncbi:MAG: pectinesterase family protein [Phycisphaerales bacterium]|nr:pectinesterase family protein [Phycisphaerales bacterium]
MRARTLTAFSCILLSTTAFADVVTVATDGSGDYTSIQAAIDAVPSESTIQIAPGVYNETIDLGEKSLVIEGTGRDASETVIDGTGFKSSVVLIAVDQDDSTVIRGLTIANGDAGSMLPGNPNILAGGGLLVIDASPRIEFCRFIDNRSAFGGAVYLLRSESAVADSVFLDNFAFSDGGAIFAFRGATRICRNDFFGNRAVNHGGAIKVVLGESYVHDCVMKDNIAYQGGGLYWFANEDTMPLEVHGCTILGNLANKIGGGVKSRFGFPAVTFEETTVCQNAPDEIDGPYVDLGMNELCVCPADFTGDGEVNGADLGILVAVWGPCRTAECIADLNQDGIVNGTDLGLLLGFWGPCD